MLGCGGGWWWLGVGDGEDGGLWLWGVVVSGGGGWCGWWWLSLVVVDGGGSGWFWFCLDQGEQKYQFTNVVSTPQFRRNIHTIRRSE